MLRLRWLLLAAFLAAVLVPITVAAAGTFYCSALRTSGGNGTLDNPWSCRTEDQVEEIIYDVICDLYGGGNLYRLFADHYILYRIDWRIENSQNVCRVVSRTTYSGSPIDTGVELPMPLILSAALLAGAVLIGAGFVLQHKRVRA